MDTMIFAISVIYKLNILFLLFTQPVEVRDCQGPVLFSI